MAISRSQSVRQIHEIASENHYTSFHDFQCNDNDEDGFIQKAFLVYEGMICFSWVIVRPK